MKNSYFNSIVDGFIKVVKDFRSKKVIGDNELKDHTKSDLHSWLQYAMIKSGEQEGLFAIPEVKLRFKEEEPLDSKDYGMKNKKRKRHFRKVDIAFYDNKKNLLGVSEIFTMDGAHECLPSTRLAEVSHNWLTPRDSLMHMIKHASPEPKFIILVTVLSKESPRIWWKTKIEEIDSELKKDKNYYRVFKPYWQEFKKKIRIENSLLIISEDGIERV